MLAPGSLTDGGIFANHALQLHAHGLAVVPVGIDKRPLVKNWHRWRGPPGPKAIGEFAEQFPDANLAIIPGLCERKLLVADVDTAYQAEEVEKRLGRTPLHVLTSRGVHLIYRDPEQHVPGNLKAYGFNVDLKRGLSIVIAPPSRHESGAIYRLDGCDWKALCKLPRPKLQWLRKVPEPEQPRPQTTMRDGSRRQWLNDRLCREVASCDSFEELLDVARTLNQEIPRRFAGFEPLPDGIVIMRAKQVWKDRDHLPRWLGRGATKTTADEMQKLFAMDHRKGPDALALLLTLRDKHGARCRRKETFALAAEAMARNQTIPGWHWKRYVTAKKLLLAAGCIVMVSKHRPLLKGGRPALYSLVRAN